MIPPKRKKERRSRSSKCKRACCYFFVASFNTLILTYPGYLTNAFYVGRGGGGGGGRMGVAKMLFISLLNQKLSENQIWPASCCSPIFEKSGLTFSWRRHGHIFKK